MMKEIAEQLQNIGLPEKETKTYLALLEEGAATADQISKRTDLNRSTVYVQIEHLMDKGLVSTFKKGKKTFFAAESPNNIERLLDKQAKEVELHKAQITSFMPDLMKIYSSLGERPIVRMFEGKEGVTSLRKLMLDAKNKNVHIISDIHKLQEVYSEKERNEYSKKRADKKIITHVIYSVEENEPSLTAVEPQELKRVSRSENPFDSDVYIFDDCVAFVSCADSIHGILIQNHHIANTMRTVHAMIWRNA